MGKQKQTLAQALIVTAEVIGHELSAAAAEAMARELASWPPAQVAAALHRCQRELAGRLVLVAILQRIDDGRPGPEEAWSRMPRDEAASVVWCDEEQEAYAAAAPSMQAGDMIAARMVFLEVYRDRVQRARAERRAPKWSPDRGRDVNRWAAVAVAAAEAGRLPPDWVRAEIQGANDGELKRYEKRLVAVEGARKALPVAAS